LKKNIVNSIIYLGGMYVYMDYNNSIIINW